MSRVGDWNDAAGLWNDIYLASGTRNLDAGMRSAEALERAGQTAMARARLMELEARDPGRADVALSLGRVLEQLGDRDGARQRYERAVELEPRSAEARRGLGRTAGGDAGIAALREALSLDPSDVDSARGLGIALALSGAKDEAASLLDRGFAAVQGDPQFDGDRLRVARAFGPDARIVPWLEPYVARAPQATEALRRIGEAHLAAGRVTSAVDWLRRAASSDPTDALSLIGLGRAQLATGDGAALEPLIERVRALDLTRDEAAALEELEGEMAAPDPASDPGPDSDGDSPGADEGATPPRT